MGDRHLPPQEPTVIDTMTDDIKVTINDVLSVNNELVQGITKGDAALLPQVKELLVSIYIRGFFTGAHLQSGDNPADLSNEMVAEVVKARLLS
jgi:hypothetical protein